MFLAIWQILLKLHNGTSTGLYGWTDNLNSYFFGRLFVVMLVRLRKVMMGI
jgi:hypothetical protein